MLPLPVIKRRKPGGFGLFPTAPPAYVPPQYGPVGQPVVITPATSNCCTPEFVTLDVASCVSGWVNFDPPCSE